jgi:hypothetical protein
MSSLRTASRTSSNLRASSRKRCDALPVSALIYSTSTSAGQVQMFPVSYLLPLTLLVKELLGSQRGVTRGTRGQHWRARYRLQESQVGVPKRIRDYNHQT